MSHHPRLVTPVLGPTIQIAAARLGAGLRRGLELLIRLQDRANQRRALREFDDRLLRDIGVTRIDAEREAGRWF